MWHRPILAIPAVLVVATAAAGCALIDNHSALTVEMVVEAEYEPDGTTNPEDVTAERCGTELDCLEAYTTTEASYFRFGTRQRAEEYAATLADGFVVNYIVMDFAGHEARVEQQRWAMEALAGTWQDHDGTFPDR